MIIEIRQAGFVNKGAELMLHAVVQQIRSRYPDAKITMAPIYGGSKDTFEKMRALDMYPKAWLWWKGFDWGAVAKYMPRRLIDAYGLVLDKEVDVVLDAAGFAYSDQWGTKSNHSLADSSAGWRKNGAKVILLPQAFGPFNNKKNRKNVLKWIENVDLIFAREIDSFNFLTSVVGERDKIKLFPDFTNLVEGILPSGYIATDKRVAIVPNYRMIDKTNREESEAYLPFMITCAKHLVLKQAKPFILVHEGEDDYRLAENISAAAGGIPIVKETNPLHIKGILGTCDATIGSRFHGLVSALSQGVPSLATGWSHKYIQLFQDYDFKDGVISVLSSKEDIIKKINLIISENKELSTQLHHRSNTLKKKSEEMWGMVFNEIDRLNLHK